MLLSITDLEIFFYNFYQNQVDFMQESMEGYLKN